MKYLDIEKLRETPMRHEPFSYVVVPDFLAPDKLRRVIDSYPDIMQGGSYPLESLDISADLQDVINEMNGPEFEQAIVEKFDVEINERPKIFTLRGYCRTKDGRIHTDSVDKIITVLLYLNDEWKEVGGRLRMLRSGTDIDDFADEVPPDHGTVLIFRRSDKSWHGHGPFEGVRRSIQMNWLTHDGRKTWHKVRHTISAGLKKITTT